MDTECVCVCVCLPPASSLILELYGMVSYFKSCLCSFLLGEKNNKILYDEDGQGLTENLGDHLIQ